MTILWCVARQALLPGMVAAARPAHPRCVLDHVMLKNLQKLLEGEPTCISDQSHKDLLLMCKLCLASLMYPLSFIVENSAKQSPIVYFSFNMIPAWLRLFARRANQAHTLLGVYHPAKFAALGRIQLLEHQPHASSVQQARALLLVQPLV
jgi:hypothetical protein